MKGWVKTIAVTILIAMAMVAVAMFCGCAAMYEDRGSSGRAGSVTAPIDISDGTDSVSVKICYAMDGASWYTRRDSRVKATYHNVYTNTYFGCVNKRGNQLFDIEIEPLYVGEDAETNAVENVTGEK